MVEINPNPGQNYKGKEFEMLTLTGTDFQITKAWILGIRLHNCSRPLVGLLQLVIYFSASSKRTWRKHKTRPTKGPCSPVSGRWRRHKTPSGTEPRAESLNWCFAERKKGIKRKKSDFFFYFKPEALLQWERGDNEIVPEGDGLSLEFRWRGTSSEC